MIPKKFVLFDCDGVLVDSEFVASHVLADMLAEYGCPVSGDEIMTNHVGQKDAEIVRFLAEKYELPLPNDFIDQYAKALDVKLEQDLEPLEGMAEVLSVLEIPRAIVSNSTLARIATSLKSTGLDGFFKHSKVFSPDISGFSKPDPRIYLHAMAELGLDKTDVIVVEDSPTGVRAASEAGLEVIGFLGATHLGADQASKLRSNGAKYIAQDSIELSKLFREIFG